MKKTKVIKVKLKVKTNPDFTNQMIIVRREIAKLNKLNCFILSK